MSVKTFGLDTLNAYKRRFPEKNESYTMSKFTTGNKDLTWSPGPTGEYSPKSEDDSSFIFLHYLFK